MALLSPSLGIMLRSRQVTSTASILNKPFPSKKGLKVTQLCPTLCDPMDCVAYQIPPSMGFSRQGYWSGLPFPSPGDLPNPGTKPGSPALWTDTFSSEPQERWLSHEAGAPVNGRSALIKDTPETSFALSVTLAYIRNTAACEPGNSSHQMPYLQSILILNFPASWNVRNKCMLFIHPVYSIFS